MVVEVLMSHQKGSDEGGFPINKESIRDSVLDVINFTRKKKEQVDDTYWYR